MWEFIGAAFVFIVIFALGSRIIAEIAFNSKHMSSGTGMLLALICGIAITVVTCTVGIDGLYYVMFGTVISYIFVIATKLLYDKERDEAIKKALDNPSNIAKFIRMMVEAKKGSGGNE